MEFGLKGYEGIFSACSKDYYICNSIMEESKLLAMNGIIIHLHNKKSINDNSKWVTNKFLIVIYYWVFSVKENMSLKVLTGNDPWENILLDFVKVINHTKNTNRNLTAFVSNNFFAICQRHQIVVDSFRKSYLFQVSYSVVSSLNSQRCFFLPINH